MYSIMCSVLVGSCYRLVIAARSVACFVEYFFFGCHELPPGVFSFRFSAEKCISQHCELIIWQKLQCIVAPDQERCGFILVPCCCRQRKLQSVLAFLFMRCLVMLAMIAAIAGNMVTTREQGCQALSPICFSVSPKNCTRSECFCWFCLHLIS